MSDRLRIGVIVASTRTTRFAEPVAAWVRQRLEARGDLDLDLIDIREVALPYYDLPTPPAGSTPTRPNAAWVGASTPPTGT